MERQVKVPGQYAHRRNEDETFDSICKLCFLTVARAYRETDLFQLELRHVCQPVERRRTTRVVHQVYDPAAGTSEAG
ncbi:MAG: hypothetical protein WCC25_07785 [Candidatus Korobacteraceae bacterium]